MPEIAPHSWFDNGFIGFMLVAATTFAAWYLRTMLPAWKEQSIARAKKIDAEAEFMGVARENQGKLIDLSQRATEMQSANTQAIATLANLGNEIHGNVKLIYRHLMSGCQCEEDRKSGQDQPGVKSNHHDGTLYG